MQRIAYIKLSSLLTEPKNIPKSLHSMGLTVQISLKSQRAQICSSQIQTKVLTSEQIMTVFWLNVLNDGGTLKLT